jgi:hypothetical protein
MDKFLQQLLDQARQRIPARLQRAAGQLPTALNPLATRQPTSILGRAGKLFNPLNPLNARNILAGGVISSFIPESSPLKGNIELLMGTPGGLVPRIATTTVLGATSVAPGTLDAAARASLSNPNIRPRGNRIGLKNEQGQYWAGENWGYQSPESFNTLYNTKLPPNPGQLAKLNGNEVRWDGSRWVRTNIEEPAVDPLGAQQSQPPAQIFGIPVEDFGEPAPVGQGSQGSTGADDPSYLTNAFKKALIARLLLSSNQDTSPLSGFGDDPYSSVLASQRELGRTLIN